MNYEKLKTELAAGHPGTGSYSPTDSVAADQLNEENRTIKRTISSAELLAWSAAGDRFKNIQAAKDDANHPAHGPAMAAWIMIQRDGTKLDLNVTEQNDFVNGLMAAGVLSSADGSSLLAMASSTISRAEELGLGVVDAEHVMIARKQ